MKIEELKAIEKRAEAATPGPWEITREELDEEFSDEEQEHAFPTTIGPIAHWDHTLSSFTDEHVAQVDADAAFIAASRTDVPALCAEIHALNGRLNGFAVAEDDIRVECEAQKGEAAGAAVHRALAERDATIARLEAAIHKVLTRAEMGDNYVELIRALATLRDVVLAVRKAAPS